MAGKPNCIFCKIVEGKSPCHKIYEDLNTIAVLDIYPNTPGMTLVISKKHYPSDVLKMPDKAYTSYLESAKKVAKLLEKALKVKRVAMVAEGMGIDHAHIKLYPLHGLKHSFEDILAPKKVFFKKYKGYLTTLMGSRADDKELGKLAKKIKKSA
jgi:histidine triad (HIT) family protein